MPRANQFRHQVYHSEPPTAPFELLTPALPPPLGSGRFADQLREAGQRMRRAGVAAVYLVHGTFVGGDSLGWIRKLRRVWPSAGERLERHNKHWLDAVAGDAGNYTQQYADELAQGLSAENQPPLAVRNFVWSGENHDVGRADGAVRLLDELLERSPGKGRLLLYCHSHGGNVLALISNLLGGDLATRQQFFQAASIYYQWPCGPRIDLDVWRRVRNRLLDPHFNAAFDPRRLDVVTFGTPIRYGWETTGYGQLLHVINHRPQPDLPAYLAEFPRRWDDVLRAKAGDYVQQLGIAGTNLRPTPLSFRAFLCYRPLRTLLQRGLTRGDALSRMRTGRRVADEGRTILVNYQDADTKIMEHMLGHAVYTRRAWMAFHADLVSRRLYGAPVLDVSSFS